MLKLWQINGVKLTNSVGRRDFKADEYDLYDVKKARPYWNAICTTNKWEIIKNEEDFKEDFVCKIFDDIYIMELQVVGYWHNFNENYISNLYISAIKVDNLKQKAEIKGTKAGLIFMNCVPNRFIGIDINEIKENYRYSGSEQSYKIPKKEIFYQSKELIDGNFCDCLENHLEIMEQSNGRIPMAMKNFNVRGKNGICCR